MAIVFDGKKAASEIEKRLKREVSELKASRGIIPKLVDIIIGNDPASVLYATMKQKVAQRIGITMEIVGLPEKVGVEEVVEKIKKMNNDSEIHGILVQLPFPESLANYESLILNQIFPQKDVDCLTSENLELLKTGKPRFIPATVSGIFKIVNDSGFKIHDSRICIVGASGMVGKPLVDYLENLGANVIRCDEFTKYLAAETIKADLLISATGIPNLIKREIVKPGVTVIDIGSPKGDVDFENVKEVASFITPVPGGVGPMTIVSLLENTLQAAGS